MQVAGVQPFVDHADHEEQCAGGDSVIDQDQERPHKPVAIQHEDAEGGEAHVRHAGVGHQFLEVGLSQSGEPAVNYRHQRQAEHDRHEHLRGVRCDRQTKPQEPVSAHLEQHAGQQNTAGGGGLDMRRRQPGMQWEHRHFDGERKGERQEDPALKPGRVGAAHERRDVKRAGLKVQSDDGHQQEHRSGHGIDEELEGRVNLAGSAPDTDQQRHRDQHCLP